MTPGPFRRSSTIGVCYYPEQWPEDRWAEDAAAMATFGIEAVRIAEFAWSRIETRRGAFAFDWLDRAVETLGGAGLNVVLCTPTATPPKWLVDERPEILPWDAEGRPRGFGGRRHYCYSSPAYREESARITEVVAARYGTHPRVVGWQTDNEHGNHGTVLSYAPHCRLAFQNWLERRYGSIDALNEAWGTVFWSQEYPAFEAVELPVRQVGRANMAHVLDFRRFSSDQVVAFNREQCDILRRLAPGQWVTHNFIGHNWDFDHSALARDLSFPSVNSYPLLMTDRRPAFDGVDRAALARIGHPDVGALQYDLTRRQGDGRWWVMEATSGPADAGDQNPQPARGMVRLWGWEAIAHGAQVVSFFRWRQVPYAQEQWWHALHRPDGSLSRGGSEAMQLSRELDAVGPLAAPERGQAALIVSYDAFAMLEVQPHGIAFSYPRLVQLFYGALRRLGLDVDVLTPEANVDGYGLVVVPSLPHVSHAALAALEASGSHVVFGPRSGSKTEHYQIPPEMPPGPLRAHLPVKTVAVESLRPGVEDRITWRGASYDSGIWRDVVESDAVPEAIFHDGDGAVWRAGRWHYLASIPEERFLIDYLEALAAEIALPTLRLPERVRIRRRADLTFAFNFGDAPVPSPAPPAARYVMGGVEIPAHDLAVWRS